MGESVDLKYLIDNQHFIARRLLSTSGFIKYCKGRGIWTSKRQLERFEELGLFYPVARRLIPRDEDQHPHRWMKVGGVDGERRFVGELEDGEAWDGEVQRVSLSFHWTKRSLDKWLEDGLLWEPSSQPYRPWDSLRAEGLMESYYSVFQCYHLRYLLDTVTLEARAEVWASLSEKESQVQANNIVRQAQNRISRCQEEARHRKAATICQVLSNRYFPQTQR